MNEYTGIFAKAFIPLSDNGEVDCSAIERLTMWYWNKGCDGIVLFSDNASFSVEEKLAIVKTITTKAYDLYRQDLLRKQMKVVAHCYNRDEITALENSGISALFVSSDMFADGIPEIDIPFGIYEGNKAYDDNLLKAIKENKQVAFLLDSSIDMNLVKERSELLKNTNVSYLTTRGEMFLDMLRLGASGYVGHMANYHPDIYKWLYDNPRDELNDEIQAFFSLASLINGVESPSLTKCYLNNYHGLRVASFENKKEEITDFQKYCLKQIKELEESLRRRIHASIDRYDF